MSRSAFQEVPVRILTIASSLIFLGSCQVFVWGQTPSRSRASANCESQLEQARLYEMTEDPRAESEFRRLLAATGNKCADAFLELSQHLSRHLKFREAAAALKPYLRLVSGAERAYSAQDLRDLLSAAELKERVETSKQPQLNDLLKLTHVIEIYGQNHRQDAVSYAENALRLYPDSVLAMLSLVDLLLPERQEKDRLEVLLNRAATLEPQNARIYATRGWFYLFSRDDIAEKDFRKALLLSNNRNATAWKGLGYINMRRGQNQSAIAAFRAYVRLLKPGQYDGGIRYLIQQLSRK
jgi:tetratricopeptide (TPR) repeat protein